MLDDFHVLLDFIIVILWMRKRVVHGPYRPSELYSSSHQYTFV